MAQYYFLGGVLFGALACYFIAFDWIYTAKLSQKTRQFCNELKGFEQLGKVLNQENRELRQLITEQRDLYQARCNLYDELRAAYDELSNLYDEVYTALKNETTQGKDHEHKLQ